MRILGIDPGLGITGYGLIDAGDSRMIALIEAGVIRTAPASGIAERLKKIYNNLNDLIREHHPDVLVLEKIYSHYKHPATAILMGHSRGVICLLAGHAGVKLVNYPSTRVKKAITGAGHASKMQVQRVVTGMLKLKRPPEPVDVTDALALAIGYVHIEMKKLS
ncbi:MAG: crossover junction endodeoxyribonuclease RuvC [Candidatus Omnitrophica bacterium]|nr:crossover junction endodeoxyribonuclease RuvC [Candidatus Omnitrophota bacterium]